MFGGYAARRDDPTRYTPLNVAAGWCDLSAGKSPELALFAGYARSLGASREIDAAVYGRAANIHSLVRVSPRAVLTLGKIRLGAELEYTGARYQDTAKSNSMDSKGAIQETKAIHNVRCLMAATYLL